jgi:hypothetical protein
MAINEEMYRSNLIMNSFIRIENAPFMQGFKRPANLITKFNIYLAGHHFLHKKACRGLLPSRCYWERPSL